MTNCENCCCKNVEPTVNEIKKEPEKPLLDRILPIVELICKVALGVFMAIINFEVFAVTLGIGIVCGAAYTIYKNIKKEPIPVGTDTPTCGKGFFEQLSGLKYHATVSTVITAVFQAIHVHCSPWYIAFCSLPLGIFVGSQATQVFWNLSYREIYALNMPPIQSIKDIITPPPGMLQAG